MYCSAATDGCITSDAPRWIVRARQTPPIHASTITMASI
jgi:hypothetical protein